MKIFLDSASLEEIEYIKQLGILKGITTNPTSIAKQKSKYPDLKVYLKTLIEKTDSIPISIQIRQSSFQDMLEEAKRLSDLSEHIVIKLSMNQENIRLASHLSRIGIPVNMTLCFSLAQVILACNAGVTYVSLFLGRLDDINYNGIDFVSSVRQAFDKSNIKTTKILAASIRNPKHFFESSIAGAHIITLPYSIFKVLFHHPLSEIGNDQFNKDWDAVFDKASYF